jgi:hypothetical protein
VCTVAVQARLFRVQVTRERVKQGFHAHFGGKNTRLFCVSHSVYLWSFYFISLNRIRI